MIRLLRKPGCRGLLASAILTSALALPAIAVELPSEPDELVALIRQGIETKDYEVFEDLVFWKDAGKIKRRIVAFEIRRGLGRRIHSITFEDFPEDGLAAAEATGKLALNMPVTNSVRVIYDEDPIDDTGKLPTSVFVVGKHEGVYRIGLVVRSVDHDDDD